jgi:hypothetical protein
VHRNSTCSKAHLRFRVFPELGNSHIRELVLLRLYNEWKFGLIAEEVVIEFADPRTRRPVPELKISRDKSFSDELIDQSQPVNDLECGRMRCGSAWTVVDCRFGFEQSDSESFLGGGECGNNTDRSRTGNDDAGRSHSMTSL